MVLEGMALLLGPRLAARVHIRLVPNGSSMGAAAMAAAAVQTRAGQQLAAQAAVAAAGRESADTRGGARSRHRGKRGTRAGQAQPLPA